MPPRIVKCKICGHRYKDSSTRSRHQLRDHTVTALGLHRRCLRRTPAKDMSFTETDIRFISRPYKYQAANLPDITKGPSLHFETDRNLSAVIRGIVIAEGPIHIDQLVKRIGESYGIKKVTMGTRDNVLFNIKLSLAKGLIELDAHFVFSQFSQLVTACRLPGPRLIHQIHPAELRHALFGSVLSRPFAGQRQFIRGAMSTLGYKRMGARIMETLARTHEELVADGVI